jgi:hypothetical protein
MVVDVEFLCHFPALHPEVRPQAAWRIYKHVHCVHDAATLTPSSVQLTIGKGLSSDWLIVPIVPYLIQCTMCVRLNTRTNSHGYGS